MKSFIERDWLLPKNVPLGQDRITQEEIDEFVRGSQKAFKDFHKYALWVCYSDINRARRQGIKEGRRQERERCVAALEELKTCIIHEDNDNFIGGYRKAIDVIKGLK